MTRFHLSPLGLLVLVLVVALRVGPVWADNWPQWRGPLNDGVSKETGVPTEWSENQNIAWKFDLPGKGSSTPVVWGNHIFLTCANKANDLLLLCISTTGKELWSHPIGKATGPMGRGDEGNGASATPTTDGTHVWAFVGSGELACFDFLGHEIWKTDLQKTYGRFKIQFGMHSTPVLDGDRLYLQLIHSGGNYVVALDKKTGKEVWKIDRKSDGRAENEHSYASPTIWRRGSEGYLITHGNDYAIAHSLQDGSEIWRVAELNPKARYNETLRFVASPLATPDLIIIPSAKNGPVVAIKPEARGLVLPSNPAELWRMPSNTPDVPSPLLHQGLVYLCREQSPLICVDASTGKILYEKRLHNGIYRGSPIIADGKIYCVCRDGTVTVVRAGKTFEKLAENKLLDQIAASPAIADGRIYLRGYNALYAIGKKE